MRSFLILLTLTSCRAFLPARSRVPGRPLSIRVRATAEGSSADVDEAVDETLAKAFAADLLTQPPASPSTVFILPDAKAVGVSVFDIVEEAAEGAIEEKGHL